MRCESGISTLTTFILSCLRCGAASCHVWFWILVQLSTTTIHSLFRGRYWALLSPHFNLLDSSRALKPKWRERTHQMVLWRTSGSCFPNIPNWKSWSSSVIVNSLQACGRFPLACCCTSSRFFAKRTPQKILGLARYLLGNFYRLKLISL